MSCIPLVWYSLHPRPDRDVMLMRLVWDGERCSGGVRQFFPGSSSPLGTTSSPIRTLSRLPSSTPLPSHRPHGNLEETATCQIWLFSFQHVLKVSFFFESFWNCVFLKSCCECCASLWKLENYINLRKGFGSEKRHFSKKSFVWSWCQPWLRKF